MIELRPLLRTADVARLMGESEDTVLRDVAAGLLKALRRPKGRAFLFRQEDFEAYLEGLRHVPASKRRRIPAGSARRARYRLIVNGDSDR